MTTTNDITGDEIKSKANNDKYVTNFERIFGKSNDCTTNGKMEAKTVCVDEFRKGYIESEPRIIVLMGNTSKRDRDTNNGDDV